MPSALDAGLQNFDMDQLANFFDMNTLTRPLDLGNMVVIGKEDYCEYLWNKYSHIYFYTPVTILDAEN